MDWQRWLAVVRTHWASVRARKRGTWNVERGAIAGHGRAYPTL